MKIYKSIKVDSNQLVKMTCDLCGRESPGSGGGDWYPQDGQKFFWTTTTIELNEGTHYPECGEGIRIGVDICPDCFKNKLVSWLREQGVEIKEEKWKY